MSSAGFIDGLKQDDVLVFAGTHPDDETVIGPLLATIISAVAVAVGGALVSLF